MGDDTNSSIMEIPEMNNISELKTKADMSEQHNEAISIADSVVKENGVTNGIGKHVELNDEEQLASIGVKTAPSNDVGLTVESSKSDDSELSSKVEEQDTKEACQTRVANLTENIDKTQETGESHKIPVNEISENKDNHKAEEITETNKTQETNEIKEVQEPLDESKEEPLDEKKEMDEIKKVDGSTDSDEAEEESKTEEVTKKTDETKEANEAPEVDKPKEDVTKESIEPKKVDEAKKEDESMEVDESQDVDESMEADQSIEEPKEIEDPEKPRILTGKRERKTVERFVQVVKEPELVVEGRGTALGEIPYVDAMLSKFVGEELKCLHRLAYGRPGIVHEVRKNLKKFNGLTLDPTDTKKIESKTALITKVNLPDLKRVLEIFGMEKKGTKVEIVEKVLSFLLCPHDMGKEIPVVVKSKKKSKSSTPASKPRRSGSKKKAASSEEEEEAESEQEEVESDPPPPKKKGKKRSHSSSDDDQEKEDDYEASSKKKKSKGTPASSSKKTPSKEKESKVIYKDDSDNFDSDEEPKKKKRRTPAKKTPAKNTPAKKTPAAKKAPAKKTPAKPKPAAKKKAGKKVEEEVEYSSSEESNEDEEILSKVQETEPTDDDITKYVTALLKTVDMETVTMKTLCQRVYDNYPGFNLTPRKDFIKSTVMKILA